ncbi:MAG: hypothetical protein KGN79_09220 [Acidobacteriota bacterium]|nr:hypothetical protein [Acidobacteriota bacterium]
MATGSKIEGLSKDERIFGTYGPGSANEVLTRLLNGSGYNVLMFGDLGQGTPREIVLSARSADSGPRPMAQPAPESSIDDSSDDNSDNQPEPQPLMQPQVMQPNMPPGNQPIRTPQEIMQEMQRRQQQLQQQEQQQQPQ